MKWLIKPRSRSPRNAWEQKRKPFRYLQYDRGWLAQPNGAAPDSALRDKTFILGVGAQKSGSSWLHSYLKNDPRVTVSPIKELHFFDSWLEPERFAYWNERFEERLLHMVFDSKGNSLIAKSLAARVAMARDPNIYFKYFARLATDNTRFFCEVTPSYSVIGKSALAQMRDFLLTAGWTLRVVFVMRDPIERHRSFTGQKTRMSGEPADFIELLSDDAIVASGRYDLIINNLRAVFDPSELAFVFYENLFSDNDAYLQDLCRTIGVNFMPTAKAERINASPLTQAIAITSAERDAALKLFAPAYAYIDKEFGSEKPRSWAY